MSDSSEPLGLTVHSIPQPEVALDRQRASGRLKMLIVLAICCAPVVASYFFYYVVRPTGQLAYSALIRPAVPMPAVQALALDGKPVVMRSLAGQWLLVVVDSGQCGQACERRLFMQRQMREMMGKERDRVDKLWIILDDAPVSPPLLQAVQATPAMTILRLPRAQVAAWLQPAAGHALEDHLYIVDPLGDWMMRAPADADPNKLKRDVDRLLRASAGWDKPGRQALIEAASASGAASAAPAASAQRP